MLLTTECVQLSPVFSLRSLFCTRPKPGSQVAFSCHVFLISLFCDICSFFPCFSWPWHTKLSAILYSVTQFGFVWCFSKLDWGYALLGRIPQTCIMSQCIIIEAQDLIRLLMFTLTILYKGASYTSPVTCKVTTLFLCNW